MVMPIVHNKQIDRAVDIISEIIIEMRTQKSQFTLYEERKLFVWTDVKLRQRSSFQQFTAYWNQQFCHLIETPQTRDEDQAQCERRKESMRVYLFRHHPTLISFSPHLFHARLMEIGVLRAECFSARARENQQRHIWTVGWFKNNRSAFPTRLADRPPLKSNKFPLYKHSFTSRTLLYISFQLTFMCVGMNTYANISRILNSSCHN